MNVSNRFVVITAIFITCLISANVIAVKIIGFHLGIIGNIFLPAAIFVFPVSYIFGDILTEVYGYRLTRRVIWLGFGCNLLFVFFLWIGQLLPAAPFWAEQSSYVSILGAVPRILAASFLGYLAGEFVNSYIMARMKVWTKGKKLWSRTITSTIFGEGLDTVIFISVAFAGTPNFSLNLILFHWVAKILIEALATPVTYLIVNKLKQRDKSDVFDYDTDFTPFSFKTN